MDVCHSKIDGLIVYAIGSMRFVEDHAGEYLEAIEEENAIELRSRLERLRRISEAMISELEQV